MISIDMAGGFVVYVAGMLAVLLLFAAHEIWRRYSQDWTPSEEQLSYCPKCGFAFVVRRNETVARCPRCQTLCPVRGS